ncbi:30S ribosomal protein S15 [Candidatus Carsonella ruddii]|nr:30S ribosomal protein S15 [Candidatus Carsonella ruddii]
MIKNILNNKGFGDPKIQNFFLIKRLKKIKNHFLINKKDLKCKIVISKLLCKIKKNINYMKNKL